MGALLLSLLLSFCAAAPRLQPIPRSPTQTFVREGLFEGGTTSKANLEGLRVAAHASLERWVVDFSDPQGRDRGAVAPRFQVRYVPAEMGTGADGAPAMRKPPRFVISFRRIQKVFLTREAVKGLLRRSRFVQDIVVYPPIEEGDVSLEMVLREDVRFEPHQPLEKAGRLVLDLK